MPGFFVCLRRAVCPTPTCVGNTSIPRIPVCARPVHPHVRGEYHTHLHHLFKQFRFIPTCVGNTWYAARRCAHDAVHPHMRGEYRNGGPNLHTTDGSSPHAWGIHGAYLSQPVGFRLIPTCVGNTLPMTPPPWCGPVHPHMRGEYNWIVFVSPPPFGSSPHAWGIRGTSRL